MTVLLPLFHLKCSDNFARQELNVQNEWTSVICICRWRLIKGQQWLRYKIFQKYFFIFK